VPEAAQPAHHIGHRHLARPGGGELAHGGKDLAQRRAEALAAVRRDQHLVARRLFRQPRGDPLQGVHHGVAGEEDAAGRHALGPQQLRGQGGGREAELGHQIDDAPVRLLRKRPREVAGPQARLHVADGNPPVEGGEGAGHRRRGVALDEEQVRRLAGEHPVQLGESPRREVVEALILPHQVEVEVGTQGEDRRHLIEHLAVLRGGAEDRREELGMPSQLAHHGRHLDELGPGAVEHHDA
jgi:hypothetical protein